MKQVINIILQRNKEVDKVRATYDPDYKKFKPHISLVYPFKDINQKDLLLTLNNDLTIKSIKKFKLKWKIKKVT